MSEEFLKSIKLISVDLTRQEKKIARVVLSDPEKDHFGISKEGEGWYGHHFTLC